MSVRLLSETLERLRKFKFQAKELDEELRNYLDDIRDALGCDLAGILYDWQGTQGAQALGLNFIDEFRLESGYLNFAGSRVSLPVFADDTAFESRNTKLNDYLLAQSVLSYCLVPFFYDGNLIGVVFLGCRAPMRRWDREDTFFAHQTVNILFNQLLNIRSSNSPIFGHISNLSENRDNYATLPFIEISLSRDGQISDLKNTNWILTDTLTQLATGMNFINYAELQLDELSCDQVHFLLEDEGTEAVEFFVRLRGQSERSYFLIRRIETGDKLTLRLIDYEFAVNQAGDFSYGKFGIKKFKGLVIIKTDAVLNIQSAEGDVESIFGITAPELVNSSFLWTHLLKSEDFRKLRVLMTNPTGVPEQISEEVRFYNQKLGSYRWVHMHALPIHDPKTGQMLGWEGFGLDVTDEKHNQDELIWQRRRIEALFEISRSLEFTSDPAVVCLKSLKVLKRATDADCALAAFYDDTSDSFEIVASDGHSQHFIDAMNSMLNLPNLLRSSLTSRQAILIDDLQHDERAKYKIAVIDDVRSVIICPLSIETQPGEYRTLGSIVVSCKKIAKLKESDVELIMAVSNQIALVVTQARYYSDQRWQARSVEILYRLSHALSQVLTPKDVAKFAFPIIREEMACKRLWMGMLNEQRTHIVGHAGFGPNVRKGIVNVQIELGLRHDFLDEAMRTHKPVIVPAGSKMECSGLNNLIEKLNMGTILIFPLVSLGQVVGVLLVEPAGSANAFINRYFQLLQSMTSEMANVILARRFEGKLAAADKMRMAGLLASGVAHNFNNLLQAVLGQASLLEMQLKANPAMKEIVGTIITAAEQGAQLIKQLMIMTQPESVAAKQITVNELLQDSREIYASLLGDDIELNLSLDPQAGSFYAHQQRIQQIITNLVVNAKEAVKIRKNPTVTISSARVRLMSNEIDPELAPGEYLRIDIEDNGVGMSDETALRCFEPFYSSKDVDPTTGIGFNATGLGLSFCYSVIKQYHGILTVRSQLGSGTVFSIYLPAIEPRSVSALELNQTHLAVLLNLAIEDSAVVREFLDSKSSEYLELHSTEEFSSKLKTEYNNLNLLVIDAEQNEIVAPEIIREVKNLYPDIFIILLCHKVDNWKNMMRFYDNLILMRKPIGIKQLEIIYNRLMLGEKLKLEVRIEDKSELPEDLDSLEPNKYGGH